MIICFSGTGNTLSVARQLSGLLTGENIVMLEGDTLLRPENFSLTPAPRNIIWAFPTYSWGMPPVVVRFIRKKCFFLQPCYDHSDSVKSRI